MQDAKKKEKKAKIEITERIKLSNSESIRHLQKKKSRNTKD